MEDNRRFLITGSRGFIGRYLVQELLESGATVYAHDRSDETPALARHISLVGDLTTPGWTSFLPEQVDVVVHLAQSTRYREFPDGALDMLRVNVDATVELLDWARTHGVSQFLFASTGSVYRPSSEFLNEDDHCHPTSMYAATKLSAEYLVQQYAGFFRTVIVRLFGVYGPGQKDMIIPNMIDRVRMGKEITLAQGIGLQFTPIYVSDCVTMLQMLIDADHHRATGEVYNLAGNEVITLADLVDLIAEHLHLPANTRKTDSDPTFLQGSIAKICHLIDYAPQMSLENGVLHTLQCL
jgi:UDP-glucose 4-epimerase